MVALGLQPLTPAPYALSAPWSGLSGVPAGFADNVDNNTIYSAGTGLNLDHGEFSILPQFQLPGPCASGQVARFGKDDLWHCSTDEVGLQPSNLIIVAKSGGDYASIQSAINSISDAAADNPYLVWVAPGVYEEQVTMAPYVHLQGAGQGATIITTSGSSAALYLAAYTSLRDLTVIIDDSPFSSTWAILASASDNVMGTLVANVEAQALNPGNGSHGCTLEGADTRVTLLDVTAHAQGGTYNYALEVLDGATAIVEGGSFTTADSGTLNRAIYTNGSGTTLEATEIRAVAENTTGGSRGLVNGGTAILRGGLYSADAAGSAYAIYNDGSDAALDAYSVEAEAQSAGTGANIRGLYNDDGASATLHGGSFIARGGYYAVGLYLVETSNALVANGVYALGEGASATAGNYGVQHLGGSCTITHSVLEGAYRSATTSGGTLSLSHTKLLGEVGGSGSPTCLGVSTETNFYTESCP
jgi:hypothetical protein